MNVRRLNVSSGASLVLGVGTALTTVAASYLGVLTAAGWLRSSLATSPGGRRRFVILVPAHNESAVIERTLESFRRLDYPPDRFEVHVVADNCTDDTAVIAGRCGVTAHERVDAEWQGKGHALNWLTDRLVAAGVQFEAVVVVDADTTVEPSFLIAIDDAMASGARAVQGFYGVSDPDQSTAASLRYAALASRHHLRPLGRTVLGLSCGLYGNGMAFDRSLIEGRRWSGHLVEDAEFQLELLLDGHKIRYEPRARLAGEMPNRLPDAVSQNERWELGRLQLVKRFVPRLLRRAVQPGEQNRLAIVDGAIDLLVPPLSILVAANGALGGMSFVSAALRRERFDRMCLALNIAAALVTVAHVIVALRAVRAPRVVYRALAAAPSMVFWKIGLYGRVVTRRSSVAWTRTTRNIESVG